MHPVQEIARDINAKHHSMFGHRWESKVDFLSTTVKLQLWCRSQECFFSCQRPDKVFYTGCCDLPPDLSFGSCSGVPKRGSHSFSHIGMAGPSPPRGHNSHPIHIHPVRPLYRFFATALPASMWFFVSFALFFSSRRHVTFTAHNKNTADGEPLNPTERLLH